MICFAKVDKILVMWFFCSKLFLITHISLIPAEGENEGEEGGGSGPMAGLNLASIEDSEEESDDDSDVSDCHCLNLKQRFDFGAVHSARIIKTLAYDSDLSDSAIASTSNNIFTSVPFTVPGS